MLPSSATFLPLTLLTLSFLSFTLGGNSPPCSEPFLKLAHQKNISECKKMRTLGAEFGWSYHNGTNNTITLNILFGAALTKSQGWIAWGVNPGKRPEMIGTRAIIGVKPSNETLGVNTYNVTERIIKGCSLLPTDIGIVVSNMEMRNLESNVYTIYARLSLPNDKYNVSKLNHVWQVGDKIDEVGNPMGHPTTLRNVDSTEVINMTSSDGYSTGQYRSYLRSVHGVLNIIGWGTLLPIGVIIARYFRVFPFKRDPLWFNLHVGCQLTGFLVGTAGWAIGLSLGHSSRHFTFHAHRTFAILIFTLSTVQMLAFRLKPKESDDYRKYWNMYHHFLGYGLLAIIFINIFKGICMLQGGKAWKWGYIANLAFLGAIAFALEVYTWIKFCTEKRGQDKVKDNNNKQPQSKTEDNNKNQPQSKTDNKQ